MEEWQLKQMQSLPLEQKIIMSQRRITDWYNYYDRQVYVSFSGGKDSTVLLHIVRDIFPDVPAMFVDTGLEYPEVRNFAYSFENVVIRKPKMNFREVILKYGYPVISKEVAECVKQARKSIEKKNKKYTYRIKRLMGTLRKPDGSLSKFNMKKWYFLLSAPFLISNECCEIMKKKPACEYQKETGRMPMIGVLACESKLRLQKWKQNGCNGFFMDNPVSNPLAFWLEEDILRYIKNKNLPYSNVYGDIVETTDGSLTTSGLNRTGCMFCAFGAHLEKGENRFQRMSRTHPKLYEYCMRPVEKGGLGMAEVLGYIHIPYEIRQLSLF